MSYVFAPRPHPSVTVVGTSERFPVRRIFCVGRNYAAHAREMGHDPDREAPFFFQKPAEAAWDAGEERAASMRYPPQTTELHHEVELVVALGSGGERMTRPQSEACIFGLAVGLDLTRRDLQREAKSMRRPWDWGKGFDQSAPMGPIQPMDISELDQRARIWLAVDGELRQDSTVSHLIWDVPALLATISQSMALCAGDLVFTGTPAGVGPLHPGQQLRAGIEGLPPLALSILPGS